MFWNNFIKICNEKNTTPTGVVKKLEIASGNVTRWKNGSIPRDTTLKKIADYFNVTTEYLLSEDEKKPVSADELSSMSEKEKMVIRAYRIRPEMQPAIDRLLGIEEVECEYYTAAYKGDSTLETNAEEFNYLLSLPSSPDDLMGEKSK